MQKYRPEREKLHMRTAELWSMRSTCKRPDREVGCVITTEDLQSILAFGYNGPPKPMGNDTCNNEIGCSCVHAEINALLKCDGRVPGKVMFVTLAPCLACANAIVQGNVTKVYYSRDYRNYDGLMRLEECGIEVIRMVMPSQD
jgi:dCMP deaminase